MKKLIILVCCLTLPAVAEAGFVGVKKASETIIIPVQPPLDSTGLPGTPDSIQVVTYIDNGSTKAYGASGSGFSCAGIDTTSDFGGNLIWFSDQIMDIDGAGGISQLAIQVVTWVDNLPTHTFAAVQIISDSLEHFLDASVDSSGSAASLAKKCLDSLVSQDDWVGNVRYHNPDSILSLRGLHIRGTTAGDTGLVAVGHTDGCGAYFGGGDGNAHGLYARGSGSGNGLLAQASSTGHGIRAQGGQTSGDGILAEARGGSTASYGIRGNGQGTGAGIYGYGGNNGHGLQGIGGSNGHGAYLSGGSTSGHGLLAEAVAGDSCGIVARGFSPGEDFRFRLNLDNLSGTLDASEIGNNAVGDNQLALSAADKIAAEVFDEDTSAHNLDGTYGVMLKDTSAYQGAAASLDSGVVQRIGNRHLDSAQNSIATAGVVDSIGAGGIDAVWNESRTGHTLAGTFGYFLDAAISAIEVPTGSGSYPVTIVIYDSSSEQVVPGARLAAYNQEMTALMAIGASNGSGEAYFNLDPGSYILSVVAPGYIFEAFDTVTVVSAAIDSVVGYRFDPGNPEIGDLCRLYGYVYSIDGQPVKDAEVAAQLPAGAIRHNNTIISPYKRSTTTDSTGYFYLDLLPTEFLTPSGTKYTITATYPAGTILKKNIAVPTGGSWMISW